MVNFESRAQRVQSQRYFNFHNFKVRWSHKIIEEEYEEGERES